MRLRLGTGRKTIIDVFSSQDTTASTPRSSTSTPTLVDGAFENSAAAKRLADYFSIRNSVPRPKVPPPPPPPRKKVNKVTVTLANDEDSGNYSLDAKGVHADETINDSVNSSPVMADRGEDVKSVCDDDGNCTNTDSISSSCPPDNSQSKNVQAPTGGTASNLTSNLSGTYEPTVKVRTGN
jgi:hypothetical protein